MGTELWQRLRFARENAKLTQQRVADEFGISRNAVSLWESEKSENRTKPEGDKLVAISRLTGAPLDWLLSDESELTAAAWGSAPIPLFTPERRANDDVTALQIAVESLTEALLARVPGAATAFLADLKGRAGDFATDQGLLLILSGIARQVQKDEVTAIQAQRRAGSAPRTKRGT